MIISNLAVLVRSCYQASDDAADDRDAHQDVVEFDVRPRTHQIVVIRIFQNLTCFIVFGYG